MSPPPRMPYTSRASASVTRHTPASASSSGGIRKRANPAKSASRRLAPIVILTGRDEARSDQRFAVAPANENSATQLYVRNAAFQNPGPQRRELQAQQGTGFWQSQQLAIGGHDRHLCGIES